jgi:hypothetical protein
MPLYSLITHFTSLFLIIIIIIIIIIIGSCTRKTFDRLITEDGYTWNSSHNTESTAV